MFRSKWLPIVVATLLSLTSNLSNAATVVIDEAAGTVYDGIIDGYPGFYVKDGTPDAAGNALSVAVKAGATEIRAVIEFPLASLAGVISADIDSATLTFNVDDVLGFLGAPLSGAASENIFAWAWNGNGTVDLADFNNIAGPPAGSVNTGPEGAITDATLGVSGPLQFSINVTTALKARLDAASTHMGLTLVTTDDNTGTSIDDMGIGGSGPPGVGGSVMPFLTIQIAEPVPPVYGSAERACQKVIATKGKVFANIVRGHLTTCFNRVLKDVGTGKGTAAASTFCSSKLDPSLSPKPAAVTKARNGARAAIVAVCKTPLAPSSVDSPCNAAAVTFTDVADCVLDAASDQAQSGVRSAFATGCSLLTAVGLATDYPTVCIVP